MVVRRKQNDPNAEKQFVESIVDKPYGSEIKRPIERLNVSMPGELFDIIDERVRKRKRNKQPNRTISAFMVEAVQFYIDHHPVD